MHEKDIIRELSGTRKQNGKPKITWLNNVTNPIKINLKKLQTTEMNELG